MIRIYTSENCPYCQELKEKLNSENIGFIDIDVDNIKNENECRRLFDFVGEPLIPIIIIKPHVLMPNKSFNTIDQALELIKSFK